MCRSEKSRLLNVRFRKWTGKERKALFYKQQMIVLGIADSSSIGRFQTAFVVLTPVFTPFTMKHQFQLEPHSKIDYIRN
ncbi:hypothetical protein Enr17x_05930 [Gimesia fumaroli]|uniref:Uncharacterized protein n=1 Tax=Gimesia fumaroli TaxID=2527976 RepID=A0A518I686_9PLAN|nr:hypothetical protein Enr17x_05930 [Gimesia fumaroli]